MRVWVVFHLSEPVEVDVIWHDSVVSDLVFCGNAQHTPCLLFLVFLSVHLDAFSLFFLV